MAVINSGINGGFKGKISYVVGYNRFGKWIMRGLPKKSTKNKLGSIKQKESQSIFARAQHFLFPMIDFIRIGFNMEGRSKQMTAHNAAKSFNMKNAFNLEGEIDFSKVLVSYGDLPKVMDGAVQKNDTGLSF